MLRYASLIFLVLLGSIGSLFAQNLPKSAVVLEKREVAINRALILWMPGPTKNPRETDDEIYTCPEETRGSYYSGIAKVSLVDLKTKEIINTIQIRGNEFSGNTETLDLPYWIHRGFYEVPELDEYKEGKPVLMNLKDYNADGNAFEFALFDAVSCMGLPGTLIGYSQKRDKVIQYEIKLETDKGIYTKFWADSFFGQEPNEQGVWTYEIDYRGRGGALEKYEFRYDSAKEIFYETQKSVLDENRKPRNKCIDKDFNLNDRKF